MKWAAFYKADEAKYQKYADECEATKGLLSEASVEELVTDGFTRIQVDKLCEESDEELRHSGEGDHHDGPPGGLSQ